MLKFPRRWRAGVLIATLLAQGLSAAETAREKRGLDLIDALMVQLHASTNSTCRELISVQLNELRAAVQNNRRPPVPPRVDALLLPLTHYKYANARVGIGSTPAQNISSQPSETNLHWPDPPPSSFWIKPTNIAALNLYTGFNRHTLEEYEDTIWNYAGPKKGYGGHAGFEVQSGTRHIKVKFGEVHSEPFTARIFHALGYNVDPTDYSPGLKVRFDRRLLAEFNSRKPVNTRITLLGVLPVWTVRFQPVHDPTKFFKRAVMNDGSIVSGRELNELLSTRDPRTCEQIAYLVTVAANVQPKVKGEVTIGPWSFDQLGHENLRELRGAGLLAGWVGWHDSRFENTRLRVLNRDGTMVLKHYFSDLGGGLGRAIGLLSRSAEDPEGFPDVFTRAEIHQGPNRMTLPFRVTNFRPIEPTLAFERMTLDDAQWMALLIAQLTPNQIIDALRAAGFAEEQAQVLATKLHSRRQQMLADLGLMESARISGKFGHTGHLRSEAMWLDSPRIGGK